MDLSKKSLKPNTPFKEDINGTNVFLIIVIPHVLNAILADGPFPWWAGVMIGIISFFLLSASLHVE